ncbi:MAG: prolyl oligopeptidase family serine peptidase [Gemmataceae bacterium]
MSLHSILIAALLAFAVATLGQAQESKKQKAPKLPPELKKLQDDFQKLDRNKDGSLSAFEIPKDIRKKFGKTLFRADANRDFKVSRAELDKLAQFLGKRVQRPRIDFRYLGKVQTIEVDGLQRKYVLFVPKKLKNPAPIIFVLHGGGGKARRYDRLGFNELAAKDGFIVIHPEAYKGNWNDGRNASGLVSHQKKIDDVKFLRRVLDVVAKKYKVDRSRVFATGASNGGIFSHYLAANASDVFTAIAPVIGGIAEPIASKFRPKYPVSILIIQGDADALVPFNGGPIGMNKIGKRGRVISTRETVKKYVALNGIKGKPKMIPLKDTDKTDGTTTVLTKFPSGFGGHRVEVYRIKNGGHRWPLRDTEVLEGYLGKTNRDFDGTEVIWEFFQGCPPRKLTK